MEVDQFEDLQGVSRKGLRGLLHESFNKCIMFHLLTVFPNNAAEKEKYYLSNVLKMPQRLGIHQFVQCIEQLNAYIVQLPCRYYSLLYNAGMMPANVPFSEADLASHFLRMCPHQWQISTTCKKRALLLLTCILFKLLLGLLSAYHVSRRKPMRHPARKLLTRTRQKPCSPVLEPGCRLPRKSILRSLASCGRNLVARTLCTSPKIAASMRKTERQKPISAPPRRQVRNPILAVICPVEQEIGQVGEDS
jgi:hypothetical protein